MPQVEDLFLAAARLERAKAGEPDYMPLQQWQHDHPVGDGDDHHHAAVPPEKSREFGVRFTRKTRDGTTVDQY